MQRAQWKERLVQLARLRIRNIPDANLRQMLDDKGALVIDLAPTLAQAVLYTRKQLLDVLRVNPASPYFGMAKAQISMVLTT